MSTVAKGYYATDELKGKKCHVFTAEKMTTIIAMSCKRICIQFIWIWYQYHKWTHLAITESLHKAYVNAEYGQEMCFHNLLFHCKAPQD